jgi:hypothetical protein
MSHDYKPRVNLKLTQLTHRLLKVWCAERSLTLQAGATRLIEEGIKRKVGAAAAAGMVEVAPGTWKHPNAPTVDTSGLFVGRSDTRPVPVVAKVPPPVAEPPLHFPRRPYEYEIPRDWVNQYGFTYEEQERYFNNDGLKYWPPAEAPAPIEISAADREFYELDGPPLAPAAGRAPTADELAAQIDAAVDFDPDAKYREWLKYGCTPEEAYERTKIACEQHGVVEWEPLEGIPGEEPGAPTPRAH